MSTRTLVWAGLVAIVGCATATADNEPMGPDGSTKAGPSADAAPRDPAQSPAAEPTASLAALPPSVRAWWPEIVRVAERHAVAPELVALVIWLESNGEPTAVSSAGARGLMQLMPATAAKVAQARGEPAPTDAELLDPARNLELGCAHLAALGSELGVGLAADSLDGAAVHRVAIAYNGGAKVLAAWERGEPLPRETERYAAALRERWEARTP